MHNDASVIVTLAYIQTSNESLANLKQSQQWLEGIGVNTRSYDVSWSWDPHAACIRAAQLGRMYAYEMELIQDNDFVVTSDADIFPIHTSALLEPFLKETNPDGDYYRVYVRDWVGDMEKNGDIALFGIGQTAFDWRRSLSLSKVSSFRDAINRAVNVTRYEWGFDQRVATRALRNGELCKFPSQHPTWGSGREAEAEAGMRVISSTESTASEHRDRYTCRKAALGRRFQCLDSEYISSNNTCLYAHFRPKADSQLLQNVYDFIATNHHPTGQPYKTAEMIIGQ